MIEIIAICGKSSSGKTTTIKEIKKILGIQAHIVKSYTTRKERTYDPEDINSHIFVDKEFYRDNKDKAIAIYDSPKGYHSWIDSNSFYNGINIYAIDPKAVVNELAPYCKQNKWKLTVFYLDVSEKERKRRYKKRENTLKGFSEEKHLDNSIFNGADVDCWSIDADASSPDDIAKVIIALTVREDKFQ